MTCGNPPRNDSSLFLQAPATFRAASFVALAGLLTVACGGDGGTDGGDPLAGGTTGDDSGSGGDVATGGSGADGSSGGAAATGGAGGDGASCVPGPAGDGCNTCSCTAGGALICTAMACICAPGSDGLDYVATSTEECATLKYACDEGEVPFANDCGCGCQPTETTTPEECPEFLNCMPGPGVDSRCNDPDFAQECPETVMAY